MIENSRFTMQDIGFICTVCGNETPRLRYTARDHCPKCLCSLHLDINPGDRMSECGGVLEPVGIRQHKKGWQILYKCKKCGAERRNVAAKDDDMNKIIKLMKDY